MDSFIQSLYVGIITELIKQGIQGAGAIADRCIDKIKLHGKYKKEVDEFLNSYPNGSNALHKKLKKCKRACKIYGTTIFVSS